MTQRIIKHGGFYQTFELADGTLIKGTFDTRKKFERVCLPNDMHGMSYLDIGCNMGAYCHEAARRGEFPAFGVDREKKQIEKTVAFTSKCGLSGK